MRIVHFLYDHVRNPWLGGGGAVRAQELNKRLVAKGHDVHVICGGFPGAQDEVIDGVQHWFCGQASKYALSRLQYGIRCRSVFLHLARSSPFELVVDDTSAFSFSAPYRVWSGPRVAIVHHVVGQHARAKFGPFGWLIQQWERWNISRYRRILAVSDDTRDAVLGLVGAGHLVSVIHNGIAPEAFAPPAHAREKDLLLFLGRLEVYNKGLDELLQAFAGAARANPELRLALVGGGKDEALLKAMVAEHSFASRIQFLGRVSESEKWAWLSRASALCMPSRYEGWGIVAVESAARGCPVIARDIPGLREAVRAGLTGCLFAGPGELEHALTNLGELTVLADSDGIRDFAKAFSHDEAANKVEAFYLEAMKSNG